MSKDFGWEDNGQVFNLDGKRWGIVERLNPITGLRDLVSVILPAEHPAARADSAKEGPVTPRHVVLKAKGDSLDIPQQNVTDKSAIKCLVCGSLANPKRSDGKYCSNKCKQKHYRQGKQLTMAGVR